MDIIDIIPIIIAGICCLCGFIFLFRIPNCIEDDAGGDYPSVSIIVPARNEEHNIGKLLDSINSQKYKADEVIIVNDESTDKTKEIALRKGATVVDSKPLPDGWLGKPWACFQGAENAKGDLFIFLDADTEIEENGLKKILDTYQTKSSNTNQKPVMSIAPFHKVYRFYEEFSSIFNIIMLASMKAFTPFKRFNPTGLFGPSLVVSRDNYYKIGGHESVKERILENVFMAEKFRNSGIGLLCLGGKGSLSFRMYPDGFKGLLNGWTKAFASGAGQTPLTILLLIILWISGGFVTSILLLSSFFPAEFIHIWLAFYLLYVLQMAWMIKRIGLYKYVSAIIFPVHLLFFSVVFARSLFYQVSGRKIAWKSRDVKA